MEPDKIIDRRRRLRAGRAVALLAYCTATKAFVFQLASLTDVHWTMSEKSC